MWIILVLLLLVFCLNNTESFIGISTRHTRNMSYDLRGDPCVIRRNPGLSPWGMSGLALHHRPGTPYCN